MSKQLISKRFKYKNLVAPVNIESVFKLGNNRPGSTLSTVRLKSLPLAEHDSLPYEHPNTTNASSAREMMAFATNRQTTSNPYVLTVCSFMPVTLGWHC